MSRKRCITRSFVLYKINIFKIAHPYVYVDVRVDIRAGRQGKERPQILLFYGKLKLYVTTPELYGIDLAVYTMLYP